MLPKMPARLVAPRLLICVGATTMGLALAACGGTGPGGAATTGTTSKSKSEALLAAKTASNSATGKCTSVQAPVPKGAQNVPKPTLKLDPARRYVVELSTNCGPIQIQLDVRRAPLTTASFAYLVKSGFYNDLTFHRVAAGFVIQGGDPNGDGSGGPGYKVIEPPPTNMRYTLGTVAMAKTSSDPPGTSGSQFFIVTTTDAPLPPQYALVGNVVGSFAGVERISKLPTDPPQDGAPRTPVVISRATLSSS
jgi:peptidyl-prolyl cis-trans isomerase B (cyclophilin B)